MSSPTSGSSANRTTERLCLGRVEGEKRRAPSGGEMGIRMAGSGVSAELQVRPALGDLPRCQATGVGV